MRKSAEQLQAQMDRPPARKVFNCIVDDTALIAGVKKNTRDGIRKWIASGAVRLYVPLYTLEQLDGLKKSNDRYGADAREAIKWLDDITSVENIDISGRVQLQAPDEAYETWAEVEKFLLPQTLLSMEIEEQDVDAGGLAEDLVSSVHTGDGSDGASTSSHGSLDLCSKTPSSPRSAYSSTSPGLLVASPYKAGGAFQPVEAELRQDNSIDGTLDLEQPATFKSAVPQPLRSLFNHVLWRIHQDQNGDAALDSYVLLTNDTVKQSLAQRFGIRAKRLEQLRDVIAREEKDYKNRLLLLKKETQVGPIAKKLEEKGFEDEDEVVLKRAARGTQENNTSLQKVWDPNAFVRSTHINGSRGGRGGRPGPKPGRGNLGHLNGHSGTKQDLTKPIDPDSFARPPPDGRSFRGGRRRLWEPT